MLRFAYTPVRLKRPAHTLGGAMMRHLPVIVEGPKGSWQIDCRVDSGSDDTIFPTYVAARVGLDLTGAPVSDCQAVGGAVIPYQCGRVGLRISDGKEYCIWQATVGFLPSLRRGLIGLAGFLEQFETRLVSDLRETHLIPNGAFPGQHLVH
jgi:hypothetical protein